MPFPRHLVKEWGKALNWKCEVCKKEWKKGWILEGHHINPTSNGGTNTRDNFKLLCLECHYKAHKQLRRDGIDHPASVGLVYRRWLKTGGRWK